ncbi:MAG TPA: glycosyltransferase [Pseudobdellovibrionaceae bacterium]|mgnify:CR=1 FL=1|nr:glycosyltransferase [Pseudobdellovibrionaceae bacterium]
MLLSLFIAFIFSTILGALVIRYNHMHQHLTNDNQQGPQKFHKQNVARIGGLPIFAGWTIGLLVLFLKTQDSQFLWMILPPLPALGFGLLEDFTKKVSPQTRLIATFLSAIIGYFLIQAKMTRVDIPWVDSLLQTHIFISVLFTMFSAGGVAHSFNIIDGYNGLSGMVSVLILFALAYVSFKLNDAIVLGTSFALIGAVLGFLIWNFPRGLLFAGDGGAYLMGFVIAELSLKLVHSYSDVSAWFPLLLVIYPVFETLFSIYRRKFLQKKSIGYPDALHLHQVIYKRLVRWMIGSDEILHQTQRNSMTSPYLWGLTVTSVIPAIIFWKSTPVLVFFIFLFILTYIWLYKSLIQFKSPRFLKISKNKKLAP